jgi:hypothetical protein
MVRQTALGFIEDFSPHQVELGELVEGQVHEDDFDIEG